MTVAVKASATAVAATMGWSAAEVGGTVAGFVSAGAALGALAIASQNSKRARRREYEQEIRASYDKGVKDTELRLVPEIDRLNDDREQLRRQVWNPHSRPEREDRG